MSYECTTPDCGRRTTLYLCTECIVELDSLLKDVPTLCEFMQHVIYRTSVTRNPAAGGGRSHPKSMPPINLEADHLRDLLKTLPRRAHTEATENPEAGRTLYMARIWVRNARTLVWGPEDPPIDHAENQRRIKAADLSPMPTRQLVPWLKEKAGIVITSMDIRNWARRGHLHAVPTQPHPSYHPHEVITAWHDTRARYVATSHKNR
jgi:hypothetical protein